MAPRNTETPAEEELPLVSSQPDADESAASPQPGGVVTMSQEAFDALMADMAEVKKRTAELEQTAGANQQRKIEELRRSGQLVKSVKVRRLENKYEVGWKTTEKEVYFSEGRLIEKQSVDVFFNDGSEKNYSIREKNLNETYEAFDVLSETKNADGNVYLRVGNDQGLEFEISIDYVN